jgi:hypothetical protein
MGDENTNRADRVADVSTIAVLRAPMECCP